MTKRRLPQAEVDAGCLAAYRRYRAMPPADAQLAYAYDVQGFVKLMVEEGGSDFATERKRTNELFDMLEQAQRKERH